MTSTSATVIDLADYRRRRHSPAAPQMTAFTWVPVVFVWWTPVPLAIGAGWAR